MLVEFKALVPVKYDYMNVFFKFSGTSKDTMVGCLIEEMGGQRDF